MRNKLFKISALLLFGVLMCAGSLIAQELVIPQPAGETIGESTDYSQGQFKYLFETLFTIGLAFVNWGLVWLSYFFPGIRKIKVLKVDSPHFRVILVAVVILCGFFVKFNDGGAWLGFVMQNFELPLVAAGLYELVTKKVFGKSKIEKDEQG